MAGCRPLRHERSQGRLTRTAVRAEPPELRAVSLREARQLIDQIGSRDSFLRGDRARDRDHRCWRAENRGWLRCRRLRKPLVQVARHDSPIHNHPGGPFRSSVAVCSDIANRSGPDATPSDTCVYDVVTSYGNRSGYACFVQESPQVRPVTEPLDALFEGLNNTLDVGEVAELLGLTKQSVYNWLRDGVIPGYKLGSVWVILRDDLKEALRDGSNRPQQGGQRTPER